MKKQPTKQANYRLPERLLKDLKRVADGNQTEIVREAIEEKIEAIKTEKRLKGKVAEVGV